MNYYIDFDSTLYNTSNLSSDMLSTLATNICEFTKSDFDEKLTEIKAMFNRDNIYNIYTLTKYFAKKYNIEENMLLRKVEDVIKNGEKYVFDDSIEFLENIKKQGGTVNVLTYVSQEDLSYQLAKIKGSGLSKYFDNIFITSTLKFNLDLKYEDGIFFDDNPKDLKGLFAKNPKGLVRIRRKTNKYSKEDLKLKGLIECESFKDYTF